MVKRVKPKSRKDRPVANPQRGEVWWLEDQQIGRRPVLVLTRNSAVDVLTGIVVAPVTKTVRVIDSEIVLDEDDGLPARCAATFDNLRTVPKALLTQRITVLSLLRQHEICLALNFALDC
jgi:mRNA interferase MazF